MALKSYKPTTPGQRGLVLIDRSELWKGRPVKSLTLRAGSGWDKGTLFNELPSGIFRSGV